MSAALLLGRYLEVLLLVVVPRTCPAWPFPLADELLLGFAQLALHLVAHHIYRGIQILFCVLNPHNPAVQRGDGDVNLLLPGRWSVQTATGLVQQQHDQLVHVIDAAELIG